MNSNDKKRPIGVFDSGLGGLSVLKKALELMPCENFIYYGDSLNAPYGTKSLEEVRELVKHVTDHLFERGVKGLPVPRYGSLGKIIRSFPLWASSPR